MRGTSNSRFERPNQNCYVGISCPSARYVFLKMYIYIYMYV